MKREEFFDQIRFRDNFIEKVAISIKVVLNSFVTLQGQSSPIKIFDMEESFIPYKKNYVFALDEVSRVTQYSSWFQYAL